MWGFESSIPSHPARSSSGPGHRPLKAKIAGSNPARATIDSRPRIAGSFAWNIAARVGGAQGWLVAMRGRLS